MLSNLKTSFLNIWVLYNIKECIFYKKFSEEMADWNNGIFSWYSERWWKSSF